MAMNNSKLFSSSWIGEKMNECHKSPPSPQSRVLADCKLPFTRSNCCCATAIKKRDLKVVRDFSAFLRWGFFSLSLDRLQWCLSTDHNLWPKKCQYFLCTREIARIFEKKTSKGKIFFCVPLVFCFYFIKEIRNQME